MMKHRAIVSWIPARKGGRSAPPQGPTFRAVAHFAEDVTWPDEAWSLAIECREKLHDGAIWLGSIQWVVPAAPQSVLKPDARFELYEGRKLVATGLVLDESAAVPSESAIEALVLQ